MRILFYLIFFFNLFVKEAISTSTSFDQNIVFNAKNFNDSKLNKTATIGNFKSLALSGSIGLIGNQLYETGFFSPFGFVPDKIIALAPDVYKKKKKKKNILQNVSECFYIQKSKNINFYKKLSVNEKLLKCNSYKKIDDDLLVERLIKKYYK